MRLDGASLQKIADHFGASKQYIHQTIPTPDDMRSEKSSDKCIYPNIAKWMRANNAGFADLAGGSNGRAVAISKFLKKPNVNATKMTIDQILKVTGLTYEQSFSRGDEAGEINLLDRPSIKEGR